MNMNNLFFPEDPVTDDDLYFMCYMIERVSRKIHQRNKYTVNQIGKKELTRLISLTQALHCENPLKIEDDWVANYGLSDGDFDITDVNPELVDEVPTPTDIGKVYTRLILATAQPGENFVDGMVRVYNNPICETIDNYNCSAYYEPSYYIARAYNHGGF